jgi:fused signal recognition particle receptor
MVFNFVKGGYEKVKNALTKTRKLLKDKISTIIGKGVDEETLEEIEELFFEADLGVKASIELVDKVKDLFKNNTSLTSEDVIAELKKDIRELLTSKDSALNEAEKGTPTVILVVGVNGNGKTTSLAKIAKRYKDAGKSVVLAAADTFRAAAIDQLQIWAERVGVPIVKGTHKGDPSAVIYDALTAAQARNADVVLIDTAGRFNTNKSLMQELEKMKRVCGKAQLGAPHEVLLVLDATTGQHALDQARIFNEVTPITGLVLTKLDGTAKGGIAVAIQKEFDIPIKFITTGESIDDITPFDAEEYVNALFE